jgi:IS1 family transposase
MSGLYNLKLNTAYFVKFFKNKYSRVWIWKALNEKGLAKELKERIEKHLDKIEEKQHKQLN